MEEIRPTLISRLLRISGEFEDLLLVLLLAAMVVLAGAQIVLRNLFDSAILWADPLLRVSVLWVGMIGAMAATRDDKQISVDVASRYLPPRWRARLRVVTDLFTAGVAVVVARSAYRLMLDDRAAGMTAIASLPVWICEAILPVAYLLFAVQHVREGVAPEDDA
jgi:TRAP-type C4-dicarboxylate transport system permease small subunit